MDMAYYNTSLKKRFCNGVMFYQYDTRTTQLMFLKPSSWCREEDKIQTSINIVYWYDLVKNNTKGGNN